MSSSKFKYFEVTTTQVVRANNKTDAINKARRRPHVNAQILSTDVDATRIPATDAHEMVEGSSLLTSVV